MQRGSEPPFICVYRINSENTDQEWENTAQRANYEEHHALRWWVPFSRVKSLSGNDKFPHVYHCVIENGQNPYRAFVHPDSVPWVEYMIKYSQDMPPAAPEYTLTDAVVLLVQELQCNPDAGRLARHVIDQGQKAFENQ